MDQSNPDAVDADPVGVGGEAASGPSPLLWALNHDLPGGEGVATEAVEERWHAAFEMPSPEPDEGERKWLPIALAAAAAIVATLLVVWLFSVLRSGDGDAGALAPTGSDEDASAVSTAQATSAAAVAGKVTPSVVTLQLGTPDANGAFDESGLGSGVVYRSDGYIVTNYHVVAGATDIRVVVEDGTAFTAELIGADPRTDLAVVKIEATDLTPIDMGSTEHLLIGDMAIAVGNPLGLAGGASLTVGVLSAIDRQVSTTEVGTLFGMLQTDAPITSGSSGGALVDGFGRLIGITTAIGVGAGGAEGIGFAVPVEVVDRIASELIDTGTVRHAFLGVRLEDHVEEDENGASRPAGARVASFPEGVDSAAAGAGLRIDDIIVAVDGTPVTTSDDLVSAMGRYRVGEAVTLDVMRQGQQLTFEVALAERPDDL